MRGCSWLANHIHGAKRSPRSRRAGHKRVCSCSSGFKLELTRVGKSMQQWHFEKLVHVFGRFTDVVRGKVEQKYKTSTGIHTEGRFHVAWNPIHHHRPKLRGDGHDARIPITRFEAQSQLFKSQVSPWRGRWGGYMTTRSTPPSPHTRTAAQSRPPASC